MIGQKPPDRPYFARQDARLRVVNPDVAQQVAEASAARTAGQLSWDEHKAKLAAVSYLQGGSLFHEEPDMFRGPSPETPPLAPDHPTRLYIEQWLKGVRPGQVPSKPFGKA